MAASSVFRRREVSVAPRSAVCRADASAAISARTSSAVG